MFLRRHGYLFSASWRLLTASGCALTEGAASGTLTRSKVCLRDGDCARCIALAKTQDDLAGRDLDTAGSRLLLASCPVHGLYVRAATD